MAGREIRQRNSKHGPGERGDPSNEERGTSSQEKLLAIIINCPVPKPTQVDEANSLS